MTLRIRGRAAALIAGLALGAALLGGCESQGAETSCSVDSCTVTFDRSADAKASVLGVEAKLIGVEGDQVTVEVAGEQVTLTAGQAATEVGGLQVSLEKVDDKQVTIKIARGGG
jgi:hypothetical protein